MLHRVGCALLSLVLLFAVVVGAQHIPDAPKAIQGNVFPDEQERWREHCLTIRPFVEKWTERLKMDGWTVNVVCIPVPPWELEDELALLRGSSMTFPEERTTFIWISIKDPRKEEVVVHELLHAVISYLVAAKSSLVNEEAVRMFTDLIVEKNRKKKKPNATDKRE